MADTDNDVPILQNIESILRDTLTDVSGIRRLQEQKQDGANLQDTLSQYAEALGQNTDALRNLTTMLQSSGAGGGRGGSSVNVPSPEAGQTGASNISSLSKQPEKQGVLKDMWGAMYPHLRGGQFIRGTEAGVQRLFEDYPAASFATSAAFGGLPLMREGLMQANNQMQRSVDQRFTEPTQLGMLAGYAGPGPQTAYQSLGGYLQSFAAVPSMLLSSGTDPNMLSFGNKMSPATRQGWNMRYRAATRAFSNPFDMLSYRQALSINEAVGSKGFRTTGQQISAEEAVTDLVQSTAMDVGSAVDALDLSIKRLNISADEAKNMLKDVGTLAKDSSKSVQQMMQEINSTVNQISLGGGKGTGAIGAAQTLSSFKNISGDRMMQMMTSGSSSAILAGGILGNPSSPYGNYADMVSLAAGNPFMMGGGQKPDEVVGTMFEAHQKKFNEEILPLVGGNKQLAYTMYGSMMGWEPLETETFFTEGKRVVAQGKIRSKAADLTKGYRATFNNAAMRFKRAGGSDGQKALQRFQQLSEGQLDIEDFRFGSQDPQFQEKLADVYDAMVNKDSDEMKHTIEKWGSPEEIAEARRAAGMLIKAGDKNNPNAMKSFQDFNARFGMDMPMDPQWERWVSDKVKPDEKMKGLFEKQAQGLVKEAFDTGAINKGQMDKLNKLIKKDTTPEKLQQELNKMMTNKKRDDNTVQIKLTGDAAKYFRIFKGAGPGSMENGGIVSNLNLGYDERAQPNP